MRVLVVDDSALMRKLISEILTAEPDIEVVATARDGVDALQKARDLKPDAITLDVEMPRMNGFCFLGALMEEQPTPVVMISSLTAEGADATIDCLQRGAVDFVTKPSGPISLDIGKLRTEIVSKVRSAAGVTVRRPVVSPPESRMGKALESREVRIAALLAASAAAQDASPSRGEFHSPSGHAPGPPDNTQKPVLVAIASSTGGPAALQALLPHLSATLNATYIVVQHLPAGFTRSLAERLDRSCALTVREARTGDRLERGHLLIAPGGQHLEIDSHARVVLNEEPPLWGVRPAADVTMRSTVHWGNRIIGVILTGMGRDGALGARAIQNAGGVCLAQDEKTSVVYGMPRAAVEAGAISQIVALPDMVAALSSQIATLANSHDAPHKAA